MFCLLGLGELLVHGHDIVLVLNGSNLVNLLLGNKS